MVGDMTGKDVAAGEVGAGIVVAAGAGVALTARKVSWPALSRRTTVPDRAEVAVKAWPGFRAMETAPSPGIRR